MPSARYKQTSVPPPSLVIAYVDTSRAGPVELQGRDAHELYRERWDAWHAAVCDKAQACLRHIPRTWS